MTCAYRDYVAEANIPDVKYCEYDFHVETKGMKYVPDPLDVCEILTRGRYENIQKLITDLERTFESQGLVYLIYSRRRGN